MNEEQPPPPLHAKPLRASARAAHPAETQRPVLVVDDDPAIRDLFMAALADEGFAVVTAIEGETALAQVRRHRPSLIILDLNMPGMDGRRFLDVYRRTPPPRVPVILCTAGRDAAAVAAELGTDAYLAKPFLIEELLAIAHRYTNARPSARPRAGTSSRRV